jgi:glycosyltransferase involved in cell wall biosynthesis
MIPLSVTLITKNEERNLPRVLGSIRGIADDLIVVDSGSTDRTQEIATQHGAQFFVRAWSGFADQRNFAETFASHDWILALDADEELSAELRDSIAAWKKSEPQFAAYEFSRRARYLGGWIWHSGWYPDRKTRLYRRGSGHFEGAAHDSFRTPQKIGRLAGDLLHYTFESAADHAAAVDRYSSAAAEEMYLRGKRDWRAAMLIAAPWTFVRKLVFQAGLLDGRRGWLIARYSARYTWLKYRKLGELIAHGSVARNTSTEHSPRKGAQP